MATSKKTVAKATKSTKKAVKTTGRKATPVLGQKILKSGKLGQQQSSLQQLQQQQRLLLM